MLSLKRFKVMTEGKDLKNDVFCYLLSDNFRIYPENYTKVILNEKSECIDLYQLDGKKNEYLYMSLDVEQVISIQFPCPNHLNEITKNMIDNVLRPY